MDPADRRPAFSMRSSVGVEYVSTKPVVIVTFLCQRSSRCRTGHPPSPVTTSHRRRRQTDDRGTSLGGRPGTECPRPTACLRPPPSAAAGSSFPPPERCARAGRRPAGPQRCVLRGRGCAPRRAGAVRPARNRSSTSARAQRHVSPGHSGCVDPAAQRCISPGRSGYASPGRAAPRPYPPARSLRPQQRQGPVPGRRAAPPRRPAVITRGAQRCFPAGRCRWLGPMRRRRASPGSRRSAVPSPAVSAARPATGARAG